MATTRRLHLRIDEPTTERLGRLQTRLGINVTMVIQMAIKRLDEQEGPFAQELCSYGNCYHSYHTHPLGGPCVEPGCPCEGAGCPCEGAGA